ncbi:MAG: AraC family transcriptional regulator ligand-binding domain-containing protein, partial [Burkholderiales bacterium]|nr:AraC family transcriptional regulator ligand-binding domain-containing protein [Burkholderiales bacterium]
RYLRLHNEALFTRVEESQGVAILRQEMIVGGRAPVRQAMELAVGVLYGILRELLGPSWEPRRVCFSHTAPTSLVNHLRVFGRFVAFGCEFNGIVVASQDLDAPTPLADPVMLKYAQQYVDSMFARPNLAMNDKVRELVCTLLPLHRCTAEQVAQSLGVDRRTVHRHLARRAETFSGVVDSVRAELAARYVQDGDRPLSEVAEGGRAAGLFRAERLRALVPERVRLHGDAVARRQAPGDGLARLRAAVAARASAGKA